MDYSNRLMMTVFPSSYLSLKMDFISTITSKLEVNTNAENTRAIEAYMKDLFSYFGVKMPIRKELLKETINDFKTELT